MSYGISKLLQNLMPVLVLFGLMIFTYLFVSEEKIHAIPYFSQIPLVTLGIAVFLSWKFNRINSFYFLTLCLPVYAAQVFLLTYPVDINSFATQLIVAIACLILPLNATIMKTWRLAAGISFTNFKRLLFISSQFALLYWLLKNEQLIVLKYINPEMLAPFSPLPSVFPSSSIFIIPLAILVQIYSIYKKPNILEIHQLIALIAIFTGIFFIEHLHFTVLVYAGIGLMFSIAVIQESYEMAYIDTLTRLPGRRTMEEELQKLSGCFSIAMLDIDHFKKLNDNYGHDVGDQVLRMVAKHIRRVGGGGKPCRYGGEEFSIIFPGKMVSQVMPFLEILRDEIATTPFALRNKNRPKEIPSERQKKKTPSKLISVTVSIGISDSHKKNADSEEVLKTADKALYKAKKLGRNRSIYMKNTSAV